MCFRCAVRVTLASTLLAGIAACSSAGKVGQPVVPRVPTATAAATLVDRAGQPAGRATLTQTAEGVELIVNVDDLAPGEHRVRLLADGRCDRMGSAVLEQGALPDLQVAGDGTGSLRYVQPQATLGTDRQSVLGKAISVDGRLCGVIEAARPVVPKPNEG